MNDKIGAHVTIRASRFIFHHKLRCVGDISKCLNGPFNKSPQKYI